MRKKKIGLGFSERGRERIREKKEVREEVKEEVSEREREKKESEFTFLTVSSAPNSRSNKPIASCPHLAA